MRLAAIKACYCSCMIVQLRPAVNSQITLDGSSAQLTSSPKLPPTATFTGACVPIGLVRLDSRCDTPAVRRTSCKLQQRLEAAQLQWVGGLHTVCARGMNKLRTLCLPGESLGLGLGLCLVSCVSLVSHCQLCAVLASAFCYCRCYRQYHYQ